MSWITLPARVQYYVFQQMVHVSDRLAHTAVVSRQWKTLAESIIFQRMSLTQHDLPYFAPVLYPRRRLIKAIWFRIELQDYDCSFCRSDESPLEPQIPFKHLKQLFQALSSWDPDITLTLDISVYSPSDGQHALKYATFEPDFEPDQEVTPLDPGQLHQTIARREAMRAHLDQHRFQTVGHERDVLQSISTVFRTVDWFGNWIPAHLERSAIKCHLPAVPAVKVFKLRLQNRRQWWPTAVESILSRLPNLSRFHFEPWRQWADNDQLYVDEGAHPTPSAQVLERDNDSPVAVGLAYVDLFRSISSRRISDIVIFENFNRRYTKRIKPFHTCSSVRQANPEVTRAIWMASQGSSLVCASFIADAMYFFNFKPNATTRPIWPWLRKLVLTTQLFTPTGDINHIEKMLVDAAKALAYMPKLKELQLWNGDEGLAALFHYSVTRLGCFITWKSTWDFQLSLVVLAFWRARSMVVCEQEPTVRHDILDSRQIHSHADAIVVLDILADAIRPPSLEQIHVESVAHRANRAFWRAPVPPRHSVETVNVVRQRAHSV